MKSKIVEILFGWMMTPILHLNLMQIFIAATEIIILAFLVDNILKIIDKHGGKTNERKDNKDRRY